MRTVLAALWGLVLATSLAHTQGSDRAKLPESRHIGPALICNTKDELEWSIDNLPTLMAVSHEKDSSPDAIDQINEHFKDRGEAECTGAFAFGYDLEGDWFRASPVDPADGLIAVFHIHQIMMEAIAVDGVNENGGFVQLPHEITQWVAEGIESHRAEDVPTTGPFSVEEEQ